MAQRPSRIIINIAKVKGNNYGKSTKKKAKKKAMGGVVEMKNGGNVSRGKVKRPSKNPNIARGCGAVMSNRRKVTKFR